MLLVENDEECDWTRVDGGQSTNADSLTGCDRVTVFIETVEAVDNTVDGWTKSDRTVGRNIPDIGSFPHNIVTER